MKKKMDKAKMSVSKLMVKLNPGRRSRGAAAARISLEQVVSVIGNRCAYSALHDMQPKEAGCMDGTREFPLSKLVTWVREDPGDSFWLVGMSGTGKTSIALTLCRKLAIDPYIILGGTFFCSRSAGSIARTEAQRILPTLAATLAELVPEFADALSAELNADPRAAHKPVHDQVDPLLVKPLTKLPSTTKPIVFVIDALDECSDMDEVANLITVISEFKSDASVKFILTSRPEMHIQGTPIANSEHNTIFQMHTIGQEDVDADIRLYIIGTLQASKHPTGWYSDEDVDALVRLSHGLFIYAATVLRYIRGRGDVTDCEGRLCKVISTMNSGMQSAVLVTPSKTALLDHIYEMIIMEASQSHPAHTDKLRKTQHLLACLFSSRRLFSVQALANFLDLNASDIRSFLDKLHPVAHIPADDSVSGIQALNTSFIDYFMSRAAGSIRIGPSVGDDVLARHCLQTISTQLSFNISQSRSSYEPNPSTKPGVITFAIEYACMEWIYHISRLPNPSIFDQDIYDLFRTRFLSWLEVMSSYGQVKRAAEMLELAAPKVQLPELSRFLRDGHSFVTTFHDAIALSAAHIYVSALPLSPKESLIYKTFFPLYTGLVSFNAPDTAEVRDSDDEPSAHDKWVRSVAVSSDGTFIASGSGDCSVRIWDASTGDIKHQTLCEHAGPVTSVAISSDCRLIASGSQDNTIRLWDAQTGAVVGEPLRAHTGPVNAVAFMHNVQWIVSGSDDRTVRIWSVATAELSDVGPLLCNAAANAVAIAPNELVIAAGDSMGWIHFWHAESGSPARESFQANTSDIYSIAFSSDGTRVVSGTMDSAVRVWDVGTGQTLSLQGHTDSVRSVAFSNDGQFIASGSEDKTVRVWDAATRMPILALRGHTDSVTSVAFISNGQSIASCSDDTTIRVWNVNAAKSISSASDSDPFAALACAVIENGWLKGSSGKLLLWVPPDYHPYLLFPTCKMILGRRSIPITPSDDGWYCGENWTSCWRKIEPRIPTRTTY